jgi:hypothetical protein
MRNSPIPTVLVGLALGLGLVASLGACEKGSSQVPGEGDGAGSEGGVDNSAASHLAPEIGRREALFSSFRGRLDPELLPELPAGEESLAHPESAGESRPPPPAFTLLPQECGHGDRNAPYGPIKRGSKVVLGRHREWQGNDNWASDMMVFVGKETTVTSLEGTDGAGCSIVRVAVDNGSWVWRVRDLSLPGMAPAASVPQVKLDPVAEARRAKAMKVAQGEGVEAGVVVSWIVSAKGEEELSRELVFAGNAEPVYDAELGLHVIYARLGSGGSEQRWLMIGMSKLEAGYYRGDPSRPHVVMATLDAPKWSGNASASAWSLNRGGYVNLQADPGEAGELHLTFTGTLVSNDGAVQYRIDGGFAVLELP